MRKRNYCIEVNLPRLLLLDDYYYRQCDSDDDANGVVVVVDPRTNITPFLYLLLTLTLTHSSCTQPE